MDSTEKITINMNAIDLASIDLLIENGFYTNRTEFIKNAIRQRLDVHRKDTESMIEAQKMQECIWMLGIMNLSKSEVDNYILSGKKRKLKVYGMLVINKQVSLSDIKNAFDEIKVYGILKCNSIIKSYIKGKKTND